MALPCWRPRPGQCFDHEPPCGLPAASLRQELAAHAKPVRQLAQDAPVCRRLMTMRPLTHAGMRCRAAEIGAVVALSFRSAVDDPARFAASKRGGPWVGLTPSRNPSGERDVSGGITKAGDTTPRRALGQAATVMMNRGRSTWVRTWGAQRAQRRGRTGAMVALARRIAVILDRIWVAGTGFHAYEMGTSQLHRTSLMLAADALTAHRSTSPKDLGQRPREQAGRKAREPRMPAPAEQRAWAKQLD